MKTKTRISVLALLPFLAGSMYGQMSSATSNPSTYQDYILSVPGSTSYKHLGHLQSGTWGDWMTQWSSIGKPLTSTPYSIFPNDQSLYGLLINDNGDRAFFGTRKIDTNRVDAVVAWGDDDGSSPWQGFVDGPDRLVFEFHATGNTPSGQAMTMMPVPNKGVYVGVGLYTPTEQLHTTAGVRFQGLTSSSTPTDVVSIDATGKLWRSPMPTGSGITNACTSVNFIPKTTTGGNLICSQVFDNGTSVGISSTGSFAYTWSGGLTGSTAPPSSGTVKLLVNGVTSALAYFATSDARYKKNVTPLDNALSKIQKLQGVSYSWDKEKFPAMNFNDVGQVGFIAQEVEKVVPEAVIKDEKGYYSMNYITLIPILNEGIKEQQAMINDLKSEVAELKSLVQSLTVNATGANTKAVGITVNLSDKTTIVLNQNVPNPFAESTVISYNIPTDFAKAQIFFITGNGTVIKTVDIIEKGANSITVFANDLSHGMYTYKLVVDGKTIDTKKMVKE